MFGYVVEELLQVPGATYSCVADSGIGEIVSSAGNEGGDLEDTAAAVLSWGRSAAGHLSSVSADEFDDLMITSRRSYHLVRQVDDGSGRLMLVYLRLDRGRSNLAVARRALATARLQDAAAAIPQQRSAPVVPALAQLSPPAAEPLPAVPEPGRTRTWAAPVPEPVVPLPSPPAEAPPASAARASRSAGWPAALPQRSAVTPARLPPAPGTARGDGPDAAAERPAAPAALGQRWADDVGTMRRLLAALRRF
jgi:hypothetical protein